MPYRKTPIVIDQIYHVFNRSVARQPVFLSNKDYQRALNIFFYYSYNNPPLRYSHYNRLPIDQKNQLLENLKNKGEKQIMMLAFCFMPNHIHFLIKEIKNNGISTFMRYLQNSYAKYFNIRTDRSGTLFQPMFKAVRIESDEQFIHVARYIHLNPLTAFIIKDIDDLAYYNWSSFPIYLSKDKSEVINKELLLSHFSSLNKFVEFTRDQVNYQRELDKLKHLTFE